MAKKKNELTYLQSPIPEGQKYYKSTKLSFSGLNRRHTLDTGVLSYEKNISTVEAPYLTPSPKPNNLNIDFESDILDIFGFDDFLIVLTKVPPNYIGFYFIDKDGVYASGALQTSDTESHRSIMQFNVFNAGTDGKVDILYGTYNKKNDS